jgi:hypothetical protein
MLLNDQLLANIAVHHYSVAVPLPQLLRSFGLRRDARGNGVTGLHADKEAVALGMQVRSCLSLRRTCC